MKTRHVNYIGLALVVISSSCSTVKEGVITAKRHEQADSRVGAIYTGKMVIPTIIHDDEDWVITIEGMNKRGDIKSKSYYVPQFLYDTVSIGDYFCKTNGCQKKDKNE